MQRNRLLCQAIQHSCHCRCTGTGSTGQGLSASTLPHPHTDIFTIQNIGKLGIHTFRECGMMLKKRPDLRQINGSDILICKDDTVWIAHGYSGGLKKAREIAKNLRDKGVDISIIKETTNLSEEEIREL